MLEAGNTAVYSDLSEFNLKGEIVMAGHFEIIRASPEHSGLGGVFLLCSSPGKEQAMNVSHLTHRLVRVSPCHVVFSSL